MREILRTDKQDRASKSPQVLGVIYGYDMDATHRYIAWVFTTTKPVADYRRSGGSGDALCWDTREKSIDRDRRDTWKT
jgi:hypothetical protein